MDDLFNWVWSNLLGRVDGPLKFRIVLQPAMAALFAIRDGLKDASEGHTPHMWAIVSQPLYPPCAARVKIVGGKKL